MEKTIYKTKNGKLEIAVFNGFAFGAVVDKPHVYIILGCIMIDFKTSKRK